MTKKEFVKQILKILLFLLLVIFVLIFLAYIKEGPDRKNNNKKSGKLTEAKKVVQKDNFFVNYKKDF